MVDGIRLVGTVDGLDVLTHLGYVLKEHISGLMFQKNMSCREQF